MCVVVGWQETNSQNTTSDNQRSSASLGTRELQPMQDSQELTEALLQEQPGKVIIHMHTWTK